MQISIPGSVGELVDKMTILEIKTQNVQDEMKLANIRYELSLLSQTFNNLDLKNSKINELRADLKFVNQELWNIEDDIRECERRADFNDKFIRLARAVYFTNDKRSLLKAKINRLSGSSIVEEKSYAPY